MADGDYMSSRLDIEYVYGKVNVSKWADSDNTEDPLWIDDRIDWANESAQLEIFARLRKGKYALSHFDVAGGAIPRMSIRIAATRAGLFLFDTRRVVSDETEDQVSRQRKDYDRWIRQILAGQLEFEDPANPTEPLEQQTGNAPGAVA